MCQFTSLLTEHFSSVTSNSWLTYIVDMLCHLRLCESSKALSVFLSGGFELTMFNSADIRINSAPFWKTTCFPFYYCSCGVRLEQNNVVLQAQLNPMWYLEQWNFKLKTKVWTKGLICQARSLQLLFIWVSFSSNRPNYFHLNMRCLYGCCKPLFATMAFNPNF